MDKDRFQDYLKKNPKQTLNVAVNFDLLSWLVSKATANHTKSLEALKLKFS